MPDIGVCVFIYFPLNVYSDHKCIENNDFLFMSTLYVWLNTDEHDHGTSTALQLPSLQNQAGD